jgi:hypothetical protein
MEHQANSYTPGRCMRNQLRLVRLEIFSAQAKANGTMTTNVLFVRGVGGLVYVLNFSMWFSRHFRALGWPLEALEKRDATY